MIILYGRYVGGFPVDPRGGYEFLAVVPYSSQIRTQYIFKHININFPIKNRKERELALHVINESAMKEAVSDNYFYHAVRYEGIVVYQKDYFRLPPRWKFDSHTAYHLLRMEVEKCLKAARNSLEYVGKNIEKCNTEYVHWNLFDALRQLFSALDLAARGSDSGLYDVDPKDRKTHHAQDRIPGRRSGLSDRRLRFIRLSSRVSRRPAFHLEDKFVPDRSKACYRSRGGILSGKIYAYPGGIFQAVSRPLTNTCGLPANRDWSVSFC